MINSPNSFNMQQSRAVLVTGDMHHRVWDTVVENQIKSFADDSESTTSVADSGRTDDNPPI